jgi:hypothetical protein
MRRLTQGQLTKLEDQMFTVMAWAVSLAVLLPFLVIHSQKPVDSDIDNVSIVRVQLRHEIRVQRENWAKRNKHQLPE